MTDDRVWNGWPACPRCGRRRQTVCPVCGGAGNQFLLAEYQAVAEPQRGSRVPAESELPPSEQLPPGQTRNVLLLCPHCDEAFTPRFYRVCPACGCDTGAGLEVERGAVEQVSSRVLLAVYGLVALGGLMLLYFWFLFRGD